MKKEAAAALGGARGGGSPGISGPRLSTELLLLIEIWRCSRQRPGMAHRTPPLYTRHGLRICLQVVSSRCEDLLA